MCCIQETHLTYKDTNRFKIKEWRKISQANGEREKKKVGAAIIVSDKIDFKPAKIKRDKRRALQNGKRINAKRSANNPIYICT